MVEMGETIAMMEMANLFSDIEEGAARLRGKEKKLALIVLEGTCDVKGCDDDICIVVNMSYGFYKTNHDRRNTIKRFCLLHGHAAMELGLNG